MPDPLAENIIALYEKHAGAWAQLRSTSLYERPWLDRFLQLAPANGRILDIGCGNGVPIAQYFIVQGREVTGVDSSAAMIEACRQRFPQQRWSLADMRALALQEKFAGLLAWDSFFHLARENQRSMFPIFSRHAQPGAALMFTSGTSDGVALGRFEGEPLFHASLAQEEYRQLLQENGFNIIKMVMEDPDCQGRTVWLAQKQGE
jgi:cyclopropane fatty-acyl-phospholipid synthase-like methyltransferase